MNALLRSCLGLLSHYCIVMLAFRGFTKFSRADYLRWKSENRIVPDGVNAKVTSNFIGVKTLLHCNFVLLQIFIN